MLHAIRTPVTNYYHDYDDDGDDGGHDDDEDDHDHDDDDDDGDREVDKILEENNNMLKMFKMATSSTWRTVIC